MNSEKILELYERDITLYQEVKAGLERVRGIEIELSSNEKNEITQLKPNPSNYSEIPIFLLPITLLASEKDYMPAYFSLVFSVLLEAVPLLLVGIQTGKQEDQKNKNTGESIASKISEPVTSRTAIGQASEIVSALIINYKKMASELWSTLSRNPGISDSAKKYLDSNLYQAMLSTGILIEVDKRNFLSKFYLSIKHEAKYRTIELPKRDGGEDLQLYTASCLFIDLMSSSQVGWLQEVYEKESPKKWRFSGDVEYRDFLSWWLNASTLSRMVRINELSIKSKYDLYYWANSSI